MSNLKNILNSFKIKDSLSEDVWNKENGSYKLKPKIRERLLEIAYEFFDSLGIDMIISDVTFTGSLANYNWSNFSDIDLHLIADFNQINEKDLPLYEELFMLKKTIFNDKHDIKILGYEVELYVQDENEEHTSTGVYSVMNDEWLVEPKKETTKINTKFVETKAKNWMKQIDSVIELSKEEPLDEAKKIIKKFKEKLKKYRSCGLEKGGEYSIENLVFKVLRRNGYIEKLFKTSNKLVDDKLSIKEDEIKDPKLSQSEKADKVEANMEKFYETLKNIDTKISQEDAGKYTFQKDVETIQIALDMLGYKLPRFGVDGKFGPETAKAINDFKKDNNIKESFNNKNYFKSLIKESLFGTKRLIKESEYEKLPNKIKTLVDKLRQKGIKITDNHLKNEFEQEGNWREDSGGVNAEAKEKIDEFLKNIKNKFPGRFTNGIISGYRSYSDQVENFANKVASGRSIENVQSSNTVPGFSQHHTGKAFDIISIEPDWWENNQDIKNYVRDNASKYGFDVTYKNQGVLRIAEPWHLYYVGEKNEDNLKDEKMKISTLSSTTLSAPLTKMPSKINHPFGEVRQKRGGGTRLHMGTDLGAISGTEIIAPADGVVTSAGFFNGACGGTIKVKHGGGYETLYCHCKDIKVKEGDVVKKSQIIGLSGGGANDKGKGNSQGPHLHFGLKIDGVAVDPMKHLDVSTIPSVDVKDIQTSTKPSVESGKESITPQIADKLIEKLKEKHITSKDIEKYTKDKIDYSEVVTDNDEDFYKEILKGIGAPITDSNLRFLHAWRKAESGSAKFNPFNTTYRLDKDEEKTNYNSVGVKNYSTSGYGLEATIKTLLLSYYTCIVNGLRASEDPEKIAKCPSLYVWGTRDGIANVLKSDNFKVPSIAGIA